MLEPKQSLHPLRETMANSEPRHTSRSKPLKTPMILSPERCTNRDVGRASCFGCFGCLVMRTSDGPKVRDALSPSGFASRSFISCTPSTTYLRQLLEPPSKCTIHWDRAYWNRLTNHAWLRNCLCERSLSNDKNRCLSITYKGTPLDLAIAWIFWWREWSWWKSKRSMRCCPSTRPSCSAI